MFDWMLGAALALSVPASMPEAEPLAPAQIMALPSPLQAQFNDEVLAGPRSPTLRLERMVNFVFDAQGLGMSYQHDATNSVEQAYATRKANCLGFTLLFVALARAAGLEAYPQEIRETLSWEQDNGTLYRSGHVNAGVRIGARSFTLDVARDTVIARHRPEPIDDHRLLAHYYNNVAMERMDQGQIDSAMLHLQRALELDPNYAPHWTNAGVLYLRRGDAQAAERAYIRALTLDPRDAGALFNMVSLSRRNGDAVREAEFHRRLARVQGKDPFHHFLLATDFERAGDYRQAIVHYQSAIRWHRREHRFYAALAHAYLRIGDTRRAGQALLRAESLSDGAARAAYQAELAQLR